MPYPSRPTTRRASTKRRRVAVAGVVALSSWLATTDPVVADRGNTTKFEIEALAANAALTDCPLSGPAGLHCTGVVVNASVMKSAPQGNDFVFVELYDVELISGGFVPTLIGSGFTDRARLSIKSNLKRASLRASVDITTCTFDPSAPEPTCTLLRTLDLAVAWAGTGEVTKSEFEDSFQTDGCTHELESETRSRAATVTATVDGLAMPNSALPQFAPSLSSYESEQKVKCTAPHP